MTAPRTALPGFALGEAPRPAAEYRVEVLLLHHTKWTPITEWQADYGSAMNALDVEADRFVAAVTLRVQHRWVTPAVTIATAAGNKP